ncbi:hypothetical protein N4G58_08490 [Edwardsiella piscicida]|nr:hypothetical protein N4G58_08490 [Edwardsiella piscicida]
MGLKDTLLALLVVAIWGVGFVVMQTGLQHLPPLLLGGLRCLLLALPAVFLLPRPALPAHTLILYGLLIGFGQFAFLFLPCRAASARAWRRCCCSCSCCSRCCLAPCCLASASAPAKLSPCCLSSPVWRCCCIRV